MNSNKKNYYEVCANEIIKKLNARSMQGYYCEDVDAAKGLLLKLLGNERKVIGFGGSKTIDDNGIKELLVSNGHELINPSDYKTIDELKVYKSKTVNADVFMMSTNAITLDGELINIDGRGNRVSFMIYGPEEVIILAGMNKVVANIDEGISRVRNFAAPPNAMRLNCDTPCAKFARCSDCLYNTICCQTVITRQSRIPNRIKVILIGEELGY